MNVYKWEDWIKMIRFWLEWKALQCFDSARTVQYLDLSQLHSKCEEYHFFVKYQGQERGVG